MLSQAVILCDGVGTRPGELTVSKPEPMLSVAGRPFLDQLIQEVARFGIQRIILLAGRFGEQVVAAYDGAHQSGAEISVLVAPRPFGTAGALRFASEALDPEFMLLNGVSWVDADLTKFMGLWAEVRRRRPDLAAAMLLQQVEDAGRYGSVTADNGIIVSFAEKTAAAEGKSGLISAGVYILDRTIASQLPDDTFKSLETDVLPALVASGRVMACQAPAGCFFIDTGVPETFAAAERQLQDVRTRPALFVDRDGTLNVDYGYTHRPEQLEWIPEAREAILWANNNGYFVFVVTNQAGIAKGYYDESAVLTFHRTMQQSLFEIGAHIDAIEWCPHHPEGSREEFIKTCRRRKPEPGMLLDLMDVWPVDRQSSLMLGDTDGDMHSGRAAGVAVKHYTGGSLVSVVREALTSLRAKTGTSPDIREVDARERGMVR